MVEGSGESEVIVVVVSALLMVREALPVLPRIGPFVAKLAPTPVG
jgi:hypothetical protein